MDNKELFARAVTPDTWDAKSKPDYTPYRELSPNIGKANSWHTDKSDDFVMRDNRIKSELGDAENVVARGRYIKFMPNSIMLDTGFEVKAGDVLAQYFTYIAFDKATKDSKVKGSVSADVSGKIEVIDHRKNKTYSVNCIIFGLSFNSQNILFDTLEGYTLIFRNVDNLKKVCAEEG